MINLITALLFISVLIIVHEFGHYLLARLFGIRVFEFSVGFGRHLWKNRIGKTLYAIRIFPLGGFVRLAGIDKTNSSETFSQKENFQNLNFWRKIAILASGSLFNLLFALIITIFVYWQIGIPQGLSGLIERVYPNSAAAQMNLLPGDKILGVNDVLMSDGREIVRQIRESKGKPLYFSIQRKSESFKVLLQPLQNKKDNYYYVGIRLASAQVVKYPLYKSVFKGIKETFNMSMATLTAFWQLFSGKANFEQLSGPLGIVSLTGEMVNYGIVAVLRFMVILSINLAILNLLPIPALDGGRIMIMVLEKLFKKDFKEETVNKIHYAGALLLILLMVVVTYFDIKKMF